MTPRDLDRLAAVRALCSSGAARRLRTEAGLRLVEVGSVVGVAPQTVYRWEHAQRVPRGDAALRYAALLQRLERRLEVAG